METCSPSKRRALAPLDANAKPSTPVKPKALVAASPHLRLFPEGRKRGMEDVVVLGSAKKACLDEDQRSRSQSPDTSSVFDTEPNDASWATAATDVQAETVERVPEAPRPTLTREEAREKVEILRLRLGLASYKLRTGQAHIPLKDLQRKPLPRARVVRVQSPHSSPRHENPTVEGVVQGEA